MSAAFSCELRIGSRRPRAALRLLAGLDGRPLGEPRPIRFRAGVRRQAWSKNVVAIGLSSGLLEPMESTSIHLIHSGIAKLLSLFPARDCLPEIAEQFNCVFAADAESIRDFLVLHYHHGEGSPEPFWEHCRHTRLPESLAYTLAHFRHSGRIVLGPEELFKEASWFAVMMGQGIVPGDYNPLLDCISEQHNRAHLQGVRQQIAARLASMQRHEEYIRMRLRPRS